MRVLVCGGREFGDKLLLYKTLNELARAEQIDCIIEGDARGADRMAGWWARSNRIDNLRFPVTAALDGPWPMAGPRRNQRMLDESKPDLCIAFPGGNGTADMVRRCEAAGVKVVKVDS